jgi:hypothetical protein
MRNEGVERAVDLLLDLVDDLAAGEPLGDPAAAAIKSAFDEHVESHGGSVRLACAFLAAYAVVDPKWDFRSVPTGVRGKYGDKRLANGLTLRHVTFHKSITAFGENLGWKSAVKQFDLSRDTRFAPFLKNLRNLTKKQRVALVHHIAWRLQSSRETPRALPPLPAAYLTYARSLSLCEQLLGIQSEGHVQQFLVAAFLEVHRRRFGNRVVTHHPHASDKFDGTSGDIEEYRGYDLVAAYEVTVRDDWKNRLADFQSKASESGLTRYVILASGVRSDPDLHPASRLIEFVDQLAFDLAVVDLTDFFCVFCAELTRDELAAAFNRAYELLADPRLSGRSDFMAKYRAVADAWLES